MSALNQSQITRAVLARLTKLSQVDEFAWYPVVGWRQKDGTAYGIAIELFGPTRTNAQLEKLARVLARLARGEAEIEVAEFRSPGASGKLPSRPVREGSDVASSLISVGSRSLESDLYEYGARLRIDS